MNVERAEATRLPQDSQSVLALNIGSASLKAARYTLSPAKGSQTDGFRQTDRAFIELQPESESRADAEASLFALIEHMPALQVAPDQVVHRIVHGGDHSGPAELTPTLMAELAQLSVFAPLHQPTALALVQAAREKWPQAQQLAVFDTSWHQTMPERYRVLPLPFALYAQGLRRYGFHGLAFQSALRQLDALAPERADGRIVLAHLGGGSSLCAVHEGHCVSTTMGLTPLSGLPMATRSGSLDPGVLLQLQRGLGMSPEEIDRLLWRESGLKGISGESGDMRHLLASASDRACLAIEVYVTGVAQGIAAMAACIGGIDTVVFSGGIGLHADPVRERIVADLHWLGLGTVPRPPSNTAVEISAPDAKVASFVVPVDEEWEMVEAIADQSR